MVVVGTAVVEVGVFEWEFACGEGVYIAKG